MSTFTIVMIVILVILIGVLVGLYIFGKKAEKKQAEQQEQMAAAAQVVSMLIIDKKKLRLKEAGLPQMVVDNTPKYLRRTKVPVVKAKIGAKIMTLMCENKVFEVLPVKKEVKAVVSGLYIQSLIIFLKICNRNIHDVIPNRSVSSVAVLEQICRMQRFFPVFFVFFCI